MLSEINSAANALATWAFSRGYETDDMRMKAMLDHVSGNGKENFESLM